MWHPVWTSKFTILSLETAVQIKWNRWVDFTDFLTLVIMTQTHICHVAVPYYFYVAYRCNYTFDQGWLARQQSPGKEARSNSHLPGRSSQESEVGCTKKPTGIREYCFSAFTCQVQWLRPLETGCFGSKWLIKSTYNVKFLTLLAFQNRFLKKSLEFCI